MLVDVGIVVRVDLRNIPVRQYDVSTVLCVGNLDSLTK
jgi:hypothetical protein